MKFLYDVNLLLALFHRSHLQHAAAKRWWQSNPGHRWATCETTCSSFVRLTCNPRVLTNPKSPTEAWTLLESNTRHPAHTFLPTPGTTALFPGRILQRCQGYRQITDALLIQLATHHGYQLATFESSLRHLAPEPETVAVIPIL